MYKVSNHLPIKNLNKRLITNIIMAWVNMFQWINKGKIISNHSLNLLIVFIEINSIKLKINLMEYKKLIMLILKAITYKILL